MIKVCESEDASARGVIHIKYILRTDGTTVTVEADVANVSGKGLTTFRMSRECRAGESAREAAKALLQLIALHEVEEMLSPRDAHLVSPDVASIAVEDPTVAFLFNEPAWRKP